MDFHPLMRGIGLVFNTGEAAFWLNPVKNVRFTGTTGLSLFFFGGGGGIAVVDVYVIVCQDYSELQPQIFECLHLDEQRNKYS